MHRQVPRWAALVKDTQAMSTQLHSHLMEDTLYQAQMIRPFKFEMYNHTVMSRLVMATANKLLKFCPSTFHLQEHMHCSMPKIFFLICLQIVMETVVTLSTFRMMAGLWDQMENCCCGYILPTIHLFSIHHGLALLSLGVLLSLI